MTLDRQRKSIMIVEDDPFIAMDLEDIFSSSGYDVMGPFADVDSGLKSLGQSLPDVAMLDYNLGRETSIPLARRLHEKNVPFIFLSGQVEQVVIGHDRPKRPVIAKPFNPQRLLNVVGELVHAS